MLPTGTARVSTKTENKTVTANRTANIDRHTTQPPARQRLPAGSATAFSTLATMMHVLGQAVPPRTAIRQLEALFVVAYANSMGRSVTLKDVIDQIAEDNEEGNARAVERSFHLFTQPNKYYPDALDWVCHDVDPDDRRKKYLVLTVKGHAALSELFEGFKASLEG